MWLDDMINYLKQFEGMNADQLCERYGINLTNKSKNYRLIKKLMDGFEGKTALDIRLKNMPINVKTIQLKEDGKAKEAMSFAPINYSKIVYEFWETSSFRQYLLNDFLFFVFKKKESTNLFQKVFLWRMPSSDLEGEVKEVWEDTKNKIQNGDIIKEFSEERTVTKFVNELSANICFVRTHGSNKTDIELLPVPDINTGHVAASKVSFWLSHEYINKIVESKGE